MLFAKARLSDARFTEEGPRANGTARAPQADGPDSRDVRSVELLDPWTGDPQFMQSLARGLLALETITRGRGKPVTAQEIADITGLSVPAARRCIYTLNAIGYVRAARYGAVPGPSLSALATHYVASSPLIPACGPILDALRAELDVTVSLATFDDASAKIVAIASVESFLRVDMPVGSVLPLHSSSSGKVHLAYLTPDTLDRLLGTLPLTRNTPHTITDAAALRADLAKVRACGFAMTDQELAIGLRSASAPVRDGRGTVVAAVNASLLAQSFSTRAIRAQIAPAIIRAADQLSALLP